jgi:hypothetical protein
MWDTHAAAAMQGGAPAGAPAGAPGAPGALDAPPLDRFVHHSEFVVGVEWSLFEERVAASCGWDGKLVFWTTQ